MGRMRSIYSRTPFLMARLLLLFRRGPSTQPLNRFLSRLIGIFRPTELFIKVQRKIMGAIDTMDWITEELD
jgi:hypothetical protein